METWYNMILKLHEPVTFIVALAVWLIARRLWTVEQRLAVIDSKIDMLLTAHKMVNGATDTSTRLDRFYRPQR